MGVERILQAAGPLGALALATVMAAGAAAAAPRARERVAVIDLGPSDPGVRRDLAAAVAAGGLAPVSGDGVEDALGGVSVAPDAAQLAAAMDAAQRAFGALDCPAAVAASKAAIGLAAARQAAGLPIPELPRAWAYVLLCADRAGDADQAMHAAARLRGLGASDQRSGDVPRELWAKYPAVDTVIDREMFPVEIRAPIDGAEIWIDFARAGTSPLRTALPAGEHVIAAASGTWRGWAAGTAVRAQPTISVPMAQQPEPHARLAARVASWRGALPAPAELAGVLADVEARVAIVRRGDRIEAWGHAGRAEAPQRLGGDDGTGTLAEAGRVVALIADRVQTWGDRAPDPDRPLLVEDPRQRRRGPAVADPPTRWWVYASILGALAAGAAIVYAQDQATTIQRVELSYP